MEARKWVPAAGTQGSGEGPGREAVGGGDGPSTAPSRSESQAAAAPRSLRPRPTRVRILKAAEEQMRCPRGHRGRGSAAPSPGCGGEAQLPARPRPAAPEQAAGSPAQVSGRQTQHLVSPPGPRPARRSQRHGPTRAARRLRICPAPGPASYAAGWARAPSPPSSAARSLRTGAGPARCPPRTSPLAQGLLTPRPRNTTTRGAGRQGRLWAADQLESHPPKPTKPARGRRPSVKVMHVKGVGSRAENVLGNQHGQLRALKLFITKLPSSELSERGQQLLPEENRTL